MAFISSTSSSRPGAAASSGAPKRRTSFAESQRLAKQRSYEKKSKHYKLKLGELTVFTQQLGSMLEAGLPMVSSLEALMEQTEDPVFRIIIRDVRNEVASGNPLSDAARKYPRAFNNLFVSMVEAGEASGALAPILMKVAEYFEATLALTKKVKSAMTYPIAVIGLAIILVNVLLIFVIPVFAEMFEDFGEQLPAPTQMLIDFSNFLKSNIVFIILAGGAVGYIAKKFFATERGRRIRDQLLMKMPIVGRLRQKISLSRFCRTYAILSRSGVPILRSLEIVASASDNTYVEAACKEISKNISQGGQVSDVLREDPYFPPMMKHMVRAGEQTGNVDGMMLKVADFYDTEVDATVSGLTSLLEPIMIVIIGIIVGGIVMAMFLPIFELSNVVGG